MISRVNLRLDIEQGSEGWLELRKTKITATDASVIMGVNPWKSTYRLFQEKKNLIEKEPTNDRMQRGIELEPIARGCFNKEKGFDVEPAVIVREWLMASLDGISRDGSVVLEIKCPGDKDHQLALSGKIPEYYFPQLQHQMYVCDVQSMYYYSFDGKKGVCIEVQRDDEYIVKMLSEEWKFYQRLQDNNLPEPGPHDYIERKDALWQKYASDWKTINRELKELIGLEQEIRENLIFLSGESNSKGGGISLCQIERKGNVDYSVIPALKGLDLEQYRKASSKSWRINQE